MPAWIHDRADHIRTKNPGMSREQSFAIATQQSYAAGKAPKDYGTKKGRREAKQKYDEPKSEYVKTPDPKTKAASIELATILGFGDELLKIAESVSSSSSSSSSSFSSSKSLPKVRPLGPLPKPISKPQDAHPPSLNVDPLSPVRSTPPPPITSG